ncbi:MAG: purine-nucleoside phosphorylase [Spirochaetales bacterium]|nr:purine-nucleoside phosphorylase [Spirochaetales bacterium]
MNQGFAERVRRAVASVERFLEGGAQGRPQVGLILGSGLGEFVERVGGRDVPYGKIEGFPEPTVEGHAGTLRLGGSLAVMAGRFHYYEGLPMDDVVLPVFLLHALGVRTLIVTNAAGGIRREYRPGQLVLIRDHINLLGANPLRGPNPGDLGPRFPDMSEAYSKRLRALVRERTAGGAGLPEGVYAAFPGPTYETPAEVRMAEAMGADLVGMSTVPEVIAARYLGVEVLGLSMVTNMAAGIVDRPLSHAEVVETARRVIPALSELLAGVLEALGVAIGPVR